MYFIPTGFYKEYFFGESSKKGYFLGYFGNYNKITRNIYPLYNSVINDKNLNLKIVGDSDYNLKKTNRISINKRLKKVEIRKMMEEVNLLICILNKKGNQIPGKIYQYAGTNKPILIILDGENKEKIKKYFEKFKRYYFCYNNYESIISKINIIKKEKKRFYPLKKFSAKNIASELIEIIKNKEK